MQSQQLLSAVISDGGYRIPKSSSSYSLRSVGTSKRRDIIRDDILTSFDEGVEAEKMRLREAREAEDAKLLNSAIFDKDSQGNKVVRYIIHRPWPISAKKMIEHINKFQKHQNEMSEKFEREFNDVKAKLSKIYSSQYNRDEIKVLNDQQREALDRQIQANRSQMDALFGQQVFLFETQGEIQEPRTTELLTMSCSQYTVQ